MAEQIDWIIQSGKRTEKGTMMGMAQHFKTKREAMIALMSQRKPKTEVIKGNHHYTFTPVD